MKAEDILDQIDQTLDDWLSPDAMRSRPEGTPRPDRLSADARQLLIRRLVDNHGLTRMSARHAVLAVEQGRTTVHAELVQTEARAAMDEAMQRIRVAMQPAIEAAAAALQRMAEAVKQVAQSVQGGEWVDTNGDPVEPPERPRPALPRRDGRPAWQTPYGPARRR
ncbi:hypothetical protein [Streptomyces sp. NBC_00356]|uniref:hypothetical protein n=1 Tax=Streptomyces sp. NBC_00356 TaxID=2975724 RepID=UPI002E2619C2